MAKTYNVKFLVAGYYVTQVLADSPEEAEEMAAKMLSYEDFGDMDFNEAELIQITDEEGKHYE